MYENVYTDVSKNTCFVKVQTRAISKPRKEIIKQPSFFFFPPLPLYISTLPRETGATARTHQTHTHKPGTKSWLAPVSSLDKLETHVCINEQGAAKTLNTGMGSFVFSACCRALVWTRMLSAGVRVWEAVGSDYTLCHNIYIYHNISMWVAIIYATCDCMSVCTCVSNLVNMQYFPIILSFFFFFFSAGHTNVMSAQVRIKTINFCTWKSPCSPHRSWRWSGSQWLCRHKHHRFVAHSYRTHQGPQWTYSQPWAPSLKREMKSKEEKGKQKDTVNNTVETVCND